MPLTLLGVGSALFDAVRFVVAGEGEDEPHERFEVAVGQVTRRHGRSPHALRRQKGEDILEILSLGLLTLHFNVYTTNFLSS